MNEVKSPKKPLLFYYILVLMFLLLFNLLAMPWMAEHRIQDVDYNTFVTMTENGEIGKLFGLEVEFVNTSFDGIFAGLDKGQYDMIIAGVSITPERQEAYEMTEPYLSNQLVIVTKKDA